MERGNSFRQENRIQKQTNSIFFEELKAMSSNPMRPSFDERLFLSQSLTASKLSGILLTTSNPVSKKIHRKYPLPTREWLKITNVQPSYTTFSLMCYNILAESLARPDLYSQCPQFALNWKYRSKKLITEVIEVNANIVCFQEVDEVHYYDFFLPKLKALGYHGLFKRRAGDKLDGCATFFKRKKIRMLYTESIEYGQYDVLNRDNVALISIFQLENEEKTKLIVANTHLLYNPKRGKTKVQQIIILTDKIYNIYRDFGKEIPTIICGDFNSTPDSPIYQFLVCGELNVHDVPESELSGQLKSMWRKKREILPHNELNTAVTSNEVHIQDADVGRCKEMKLSKCQMPIPQSECTMNYGNETPIISSGSKYYHHALKKCELTSAYRHIDVVTGNRELTTYHSDFEDTIDYIFYTHTNIRIKRILRLLDRSNLEEMRGLPNPYLPSDHLSLAILCDIVNFHN